VRIGKFAIPILLLLSILGGTVAAVAYVVLTWTVTLPVAANPRVHFWDGSNAANTMEITMNIFPSIRTIDENNDDWDIRSNDVGNVYIRVDAMNTTAISEVVIIAYVSDPASPLFDLTWTSADAEGSWQGPYSTAATTDYNLWIEVLADAQAYPTSEESIAVELKVEEP
jgi:hypothetical protein